MRLGVPIRTTIIWLGLMLAAGLQWWLGTGEHVAGQTVRALVVLTVVVGFTKVYFIGSEFMEIRSAPRALHAAFAAWVVVVGSATVVLAVA
jgi:Prokaryotic Cytochrome C oxidase subunit IV